MQENEQKLTIKIHRRFRRRRSSVLQRQNTDYHVLYTTLTFQAGTTAILNWVLELFSIINPVLILILKLYYFHTMDNKRQVFCCNHLVQRVCLPSPSRSCPTCLRSLMSLYLVVVPKRGLVPSMGREVMTVLRFPYGPMLCSRFTRLQLTVK